MPCLIGMPACCTFDSDRKRYAFGSFGLQCHSVPSVLAAIWMAVPTCVAGVKVLPDGLNASTLLLLSRTHAVLALPSETCTSAPALPRGPSKLVPFQRN